MSLLDSTPCDSTPHGADTTAERPRTTAEKAAAGKPAEKKPGKYPHGVNWPIFGWIALLHIGALAAPFFFSWTGLILMFVLHWVTGGLGICLGFHRQLTHGSFQTHRFTRGLLSFIGGLAGEGSVIDWVANHRKHHALSDREGDPHSPHDGPWWSHMLWFLPQMTAEEHAAHVKRWAPDLQRDPMMRIISALFLPSHFAVALGLFAIGYAVGDWSFGLSLMLWGAFMRVVFVLHSTWLVNSASHMWGYTNYETTDDSRNNWFVALITYGEGWHNSHHGYARMTAHGARRRDFDLTFAFVRLMQYTGLAWDVVDYRRKSEREPHKQLDSHTEAEAHETASESSAA